MHTCTDLKKCQLPTAVTGDSTLDDGSYDIQHMAREDSSFSCFCCALLS